MRMLRLPNPKTLRKTVLRLKRFDVVSVRERNMVEFLKQHYERESIWVMGAVFLLGKEFWIGLAEKDERAEGKGKAVSRILDPAEIKRKVLLLVASKLEAPMLDMVMDEQTVERFNLPGTKAEVNLYEWLANIAHYRFSVTDSFHGVCFALIFNKPFICINNQSRGEERFISLLDTFHLRNRIFPADIFPVLDDGIVELDCMPVKAYYSFMRCCQFNGLGKL